MKKAELAYARPLAEVCKAEIEKTVGAIPRGVAPPNQWSATGGGINIPLNASVPEVVRTPGFFRFVKEVNAAMRSLFCRLSAAFTSMECGRLDEILAKQGQLDEEDLAELLATPKMRPLSEIEHAFESNRWPREVLDTLLPLVQARCRLAPDVPPARVWRKGFGYAFVLGGPAGGAHATLRILPVAHCGPSGVVETWLIEMERVKRVAPLSELCHQGAIYEAIGHQLEAEFVDEVPAGSAGCSGRDAMGQRNPHSGALE